MGLQRYLRALGEDDLPDRIKVSDAVFRLEKEFKHNGLAAVGLYACGTDRAVLKCYRRAPFLGLPLEWAGRLMARYEAAVLREAEGIRGVPAFRGFHGRTGLVRDFVPGQPLSRRADVDMRFLKHLFRTIRALHRRGIAYVDLEKAKNIVIGEDGLPHLIDFQVAFYVPERFLGRTFPVRWLRGLLKEADLYHARKHFRRLMRDRLSRRQKNQLRRKPWFVDLSNVLHAPYKKLRRWLFGRGA